MFHMPCLSSQDGVSLPYACVASVWVTLFNLFPASGDARTAATKAEIRSLCQQLDSLLSRRDKDVVELSNSVREMRRSKQQSSAPAVQRALKRIVALKRSRNSIMQHMNTLESQLDAIESTAFNSQLVRTMKDSANTMRRMGVSASIKEADDALASLEDNLATAGELSSTLAVPLVENVEDDELEAELQAILLEDCNTEQVAQPLPTSIQPPSLTSSMCGAAEHAVSEPVPVQPANLVEIDDDPVCERNVAVVN